jgi:hypothetical protein
MSRALSLRLLIVAALSAGTLAVSASLASARSAGYECGQFWEGGSCTDVCTGIQCGGGTGGFGCCHGEEECDSCD